MTDQVKPFQLRFMVMCVLVLNFIFEMDCANNYELICDSSQQIDCVVKLTGMPDLSMSFMNPRMFDDTSFHPCVRFKRWEVSSNFVYSQKQDLIYILAE